MPTASELYPEPCAFCRISEAYPAGATPVPDNPDSEKVQPQCHLILSTPYVLAFLDIMPIAPGHILVTTRDHYRKLSDLYTPRSSTFSDWVSQKAHEELRKTSQELGRWLPIISRALSNVTGIEDWNVVQNNGARAAQVVPHIHFHIIPRYQEGRLETERKGHVDAGMLKSWRMFGRGARDDLDDDEAAELSKKLRAAIEKEIEGDVPDPKSKL